MLLLNVTVTVSLRTVLQSHTSQSPNCSPFPTYCYQLQLTVSYVAGATKEQRNLTFSLEYS
jgi:hypothetical protein